MVNPQSDRPDYHENGTADHLVENLVAIEARKREEERRDAETAARIREADASARLMDAQAKVAAKPTTPIGDEIIVVLQEFVIRHSDITEEQINRMEGWTKVVSKTEGATASAYLEALYILSAGSCPQVDSH